MPIEIAHIVCANLYQLMHSGVPISASWTSCNIDGLSLEIGAAQCILIIEKQGMFRRLCEDNFPLRFPCILVTGKIKKFLFSRRLTLA